jgi:hypothetical protein
MKKNRHSTYLGFLGFVGFAGFQYFQNHSIATLSYFAYFGFFAYFWINKISKEMKDERYLENSRKAKAFTLDIAIFELVILYMVIPLNFISKEILTVFSALCFASLILSYALTFYKFEKM